MRTQEEVRQSVTQAEPVQYYFTLAQQPGPVQVQGQQQGQQVAAPTATTLQPGQIIIAQPQQGQVTEMRKHITAVSVVLRCLCSDCTKILSNIRAPANVQMSYSLYYVLYSKLSI